MSKLVVFEGLDGSGKTTQLKLLDQYLNEKGIEHVLVCDPGTTKIGDKIRKIVEDEKEGNPAIYTELLLFCAARSQLVAEVVVPMLKKNILVVSDRFSASTIAYQVYGRGLNMDIVQSMAHIAAQGVKPHLQILLDKGEEGELSYSIPKSRIEKLGTEFQKRVRKGYLEQVKKEKESWFVLDANEDQSKIAQMVGTKVLSLI